ncbi:hypothetical protein FRC02_004365 [Tulasnella sp. 418]|nr:hypothetical protein FRC02_004365 [Tulasnella sp. 418]
MAPSMPMSPEKRLQRAFAKGQRPAVGIGKKLSARAAAKLYNVSASTLCDRRSGKHAPSESAHQSQSLLTKEQEQVLVEWLVLETAHPVTRKTIGPKVHALCGKAPGRNWIIHFLKLAATKDVNPRGKRQMRG